jgi:multidrug efflux pump subunit AcrB
MNLTRLAFRYKPVSYLLAALVMALGVAALFSMSRREDPDLKGRFAQIIALYPGATAREVEELVTERLERTLREIDDVSTVTSTSRPGIAVLQVEAADRMTGTLDKLMDDIRERVADARPDLPSGVVGVSVNDRFSDTAAMIVGVTQPGASPRRLEDHAKRVRDRLRVLPQVAEARLLGDREEVVTVALSSQRLASFGGAVTPDAIASVLSRRNVLPLTGGSVASGDARLSIAPSGQFGSLAEMENLIIGQGNGSAPVYLRDVASVTRGYADPPATLVRVSGEPAVAVVLTMRKGENINALGARVEKVLHELEGEIAGAKLTVVNDLPRSVERRVEGFFHELQLAVIIIFGVMFLFMGWRSALLVGAMLPISMLGTFAAMWFSGRDIQQMSIAALIIALALVVDNSIVILDNIEEKMAEGMDRETASVSGADELRAPLVSSNLVAILSFLPLAFLPGGVGDFIKDLGLVTSLSLVVSVFLNLTVLPLLCYQFLTPAREARNPVQRWLNGVVDGLKEGKASLASWSLHRPGIVVAVAAVALFGSVSLIPKLGFAFFPPAERDQFVVDVWLPEGRDILATERAAARVEAILKKQTGVRSFVTYVGQGGPRFYYNVSPEAPTANYAQIVVNTESIAVTEKLVRAVQAEASSAVAGARVVAKKLEQGPPVGAPVAIRISGRDVDTLRKIAGDVRAVLNETPGALSVHDNYGELPLRLEVDVDDDRAALLGLSSAAVAQTARLAFSGQTVSLLREGDKEIRVDLRLDPAERADAADLPDLYLTGTAGAVPLRQVATVRLAPDEGRIVRRNAERTVTVFAFTDGTRLASAVLADAKTRLAANRLPDGYALSFGGEAEESGKSFSNMGVVFAVAFVLNVVILTVQFNSFPVVLAVLAAVPLGVIGAVPGLYLAGQNFGFMAFLGIAALGGIVTNHTIFIFRYAQEERDRHGVSMADALVDASRRRLRPILLTVLLSVGALLPQALSGSKLWPPLDWAIIAGLSVSTFLSIIVVPSVYVLFSRGSAWQAAERRGADVPVSMPAEVR